MQPIVQDRERHRLKFSVWDLLLLTTFVGVVFALPDVALQFLAAISTAALLNLVFLAYFSIPSEKTRKGTINHWFRRMIGRAFIYCVATCVVSCTAIFLRYSG